MQKIQEHIPAKGRILLVLDYDGTLVPIVRKPKEAVFPRSTCDILADLIASRRVILSVISGRSLRDIRSRIGLKSIYYAGNHGLEISGPGLRFRHPEAVALRPLLRVLRDDLTQACAGIHGVFLEDKGLSLSLHYRNIAGGVRRRFTQGLMPIRKKYRGSPIVWKMGKKVWNILPRISWDKGKAVLLLMERFKGLIFIAIGDDRTDQDMFRVLEGGGVAIHVGRGRGSQARFHMRSAGEVLLFLKSLCP